MSEIHVEEGGVVVDVVGCARCHGEGHKGLRFVPLAYPITVVDPPLTHWASCPTNGEPILLRVEPTG